MIAYSDKPCGFCKGTTRGDTCPLSLTCPTCKVGPKRRCKNPSGHKYMGIHSDRFKAAYAIDDANGFDYKAAYADFPRDGEKKDAGATSGPIGARIILPPDWRKESCDKSGHLFDEGACLRCTAKQATPSDIQEIRTLQRIAS